MYGWGEKILIFSYFPCRKKFATQKLRKIHIKKAIGWTNDIIISAGLCRWLCTELQHIWCQIYFWYIDGYMMIDEIIIYFVYLHFKFVFKIKFLWNYSHFMINRIFGGRRNFWIVRLNGKAPENRTLYTITFEWDA